MSHRSDLSVGSQCLSVCECFLAPEIICDPIRFLDGSVSQFSGHFRASTPTQPNCRRLTV